MPKITDRAVELGLYLPLGAYARAREGLSDLGPDRLKDWFEEGPDRLSRLFDELVDRGQERAQSVQTLVRRRASRAEDVVEKTADTVTREVRKGARKANSAAAKLPRVAAPKTASELPIASYNSLTASEILTELRGLTQTQLAKVYKFEKATEGRATILETIDSRLVPLPIASYDALTVNEISARLASLSPNDLKTLRRYEADTKNRTTVLEKIDTHL